MYEVNTKNNEDIRHNDKGLATPFLIPFLGTREDYIFQAPLVLGKTCDSLAYGI